MTARTGGDALTRSGDESARATDFAATGRDTVRFREHVELGPNSYDVLIGPGALGSLAEVLPATIRRTVVISQPGVPVEVETGRDTINIEIGGEGEKNLATVERVASRMVAEGISRADCVVAVGGGVVTDVGGFVAATYHRGIPVIHVATTLLGQVDAAIGGKTAVNLPSGKNLVGVYWQPSTVICDTDVLESLPEREMLCGLGEIAKYRFLGAGPVETMEITDQVRACVRHKADVVAADEREAGLRATLNYGHTLGHAVEIASCHRLAHGEAVAVGLMFAALLARRLGRIDAARVAEHAKVLEALNLPILIPEGLQGDALVALMRRDKKARRALTFVLDGPAGVEEVDDVAEADVRAALRDQWSLRGA